MFISKRILLGAFVLLAAVCLSTTTTVYADDGPPEPPTAGRRIRLEKAAELLDMSLEELQAALDSGATLRELAEEAGITLEDVRPRRHNRIEGVADRLGMTVEELQAALDSGATLRELAEQQGLLPIE